MMILSYTLLVCKFCRYIGQELDARNVPNHVLEHSGNTSVFGTSWNIEGFTLYGDVYIIWGTKESVSAFKLKHAGRGQKVPSYF